MQRRTVLRWLTAAAATAAGACVSSGPGPSPVASRSSAGLDPSATAPPASARPPEQPDGVAKRSADPEPAQAEATRLSVVCRSEWGARDARAAFAEHQIRTLTVHHTAVAHTDPDEGASRARQHQRYHQEAGFVDLAYHHLIDRDGDVYEGRPVTAPGETFTDYDPRGHYLPCLEGDFDRQAPSEAQLAALVDLLAWAAGRFGVDPGTIAGHRAYASTSCPGDALQALVDDGTIRSRVEARLADGGVVLVDGCA